MPMQPTALATPSFARLLTGAALLGLVVSTQYLFQPFIWRYWRGDAIAVGWIEVLRDRAVVCAWLAIGAWVALRRTHADHEVRDLPLAVAVATGAVLGELSLMALQVPTAADGWPALLGRALRWSVVAAALLALHRLWQRSVETEIGRRRAERERHDAEAQWAQLQLLALRTQIEPHFLFNTLATVQRLAQTDRVQGARLLDHLITFFRLSTEAAPGPQHWTIGQEMALVAAYLGIIERRMDGRLALALDCEAGADGLDCPPLLLATLVENAVQHGIAFEPSGGRIDVTVRRCGADVELRVVDTGAGFTKQSGSGIGLANSRARLASLHGARAHLTLAANCPHGVVATVRMPATESSR